MRQPLYIFSQFSGAISVERWMQSTGVYVICPYYHAVSDTPLSYIRPLYRHRLTDEFQRDLDWLQKHFQPIRWQQIEKAQEDKIPAFCLSFDDGLRSFYTIVAPILKERGIPCIQFLNSAFVDNRALMYRYKAALIISRLQEQGRMSRRARQSLLGISYSRRNELDAIAQSIGLDFEAWQEREKPYLSRSEIIELQEQGFQFGAHSIDHPHYGELTAEEQIHQTCGSCADLETMGISVEAFSYPFGRESVHAYVEQKTQQKVHAFFTTQNIQPQIAPYYHRFWAEGENYPMSSIVRGEYLRYWMHNGFKKHI